MALVEEFREEWRSRIQTESPQLSLTDRESVVAWLLGENEERYVICCLPK